MGGNVSAPGPAATSPDWVIPFPGRLYVGESAVGTLTIEGGGTVSNTYSYIGFLPGAAGSSATVSGNGSTWTHTDDPNISLGSLSVGYDGAGTLLVEGGGTVSNTNGYIGHNAGAAGSSATVSGNGSTWTNTNNLSVGYGGAGTLTIENGGAVSSTYGTIGNASTGSSSITVSGPGSTWTNALGITIGLNSTGTLTIENGGTVSGNSPIIGLLPGVVGSVTISGPGSTWTAGGELYVGYQGTGMLTIENGGTLSSMVAYIGLSPTAAGSSARVSGSGSTWINTGLLRVGNGGGGTLTIENGGTVSSSAGAVGSAVEASSVRVSGAGSAWTNAGDLSVGDLGDATLTIAEGARVSAGDGAGGPGTVHIGDSLGNFRSGTLTIGAAAGDAPVAAGTLEAARIEFRNGFGTIDFNHSGATTFSAALDSVGAGAHAFNHYAGTTTLTGDSAGFAGTTTVSGGSLIVGTSAGGTLGGSMTIGAGALLGGTGTVGSAGSAVTIAVGGVHAPGNSIGVQHIAGDYVNHGTLRIEATPAEADSIVVDGAVDITGATLELLLSPADAGSWGVLNRPHVIIDQQGSGDVIGTFAQPFTQNLLFLDALIAYDGGDGNDVTLELVRNDVLFAGAGHTPNQIAAALAVDTLENTHDVWRAIALASDPDIVRSSFDALSGEIHAAAQTALIEDSRFVRNAVNDRLRTAFAAEGAAYVPVLAYGPGSAPLLAAPAPDGPAFWIGGFGSRGLSNSDGNAASLGRDTGGLLIGADAFLGDWRIGLLAGYSQSSFTVGDRASAGSSGNYHLGLYGGTQWGALAVRSGLAYSWHDVDTARAVAIPGITESLAASYRAQTFQAFGELGYGFDIGHSRLEPFANLAYVNLQAGGFSETGGNAALAGTGGGADIGFTTLGLRAEHAATLGTADVTFKGMLGWRHALGDITPASTHAFSAGAAFAIAGAPTARDSAILEAGFELNLTPDATFDLSYSGQIAADAYDHGIKANLGVRF